MSSLSKTYTLTFGDRCENHAGMEIKGVDVGEGMGFNREDLLKVKEYFENKGCKCELIHLNNLLKDVNIVDEIDDAYLLVVKNMMNGIIDKEDDEIDNDVIKEMESFEWDNKYWDRRRQKVLNKHARENVCFGDESSEPDYENGKGRIVGWNDVPIIKKIRERIEEIVGEKGSNLMCEGNKYKNEKDKDKKNGGIGWHGDAERRKVWAMRFGEKMVLKYKWWNKSQSVGELFEVELNDGDGYLMSEKAVGYDWLKKKIYTLRHSAGSSKYVKIIK